MTNTVLQQLPQDEHATQIRRRRTPQWKRVLDIVGVLAVTPFLLPILLLAGIYIKLVSTGPVMFVQSRIGHGGEPFRIYKFRTMHTTSVSRDETHRNYVASYASIDSPIKKPNHRGDLIPGGNLLRQLAIDELPQLFNVWRGDMSLVGPRPDVLWIEDYEEWQLRRFEVVPGITGLWQVSGKNRLSFQQMIELDIEYIETRSLARDLQIIAKTFKVLLAEYSE